MTFLPGQSLHLFLQCIIKTNYIVSVSSFTRLIITSVMIFINLFFSFVLPSNSFCQTWNLLATLVIQIGKKNVRKMSTSAKRVSDMLFFWMIFYHIFPAWYLACFLVCKLIYNTELSNWSWDSVVFCCSL